MKKTYTLWKYTNYFYGKRDLIKENMDTYEEAFKLALQESRKCTRKHHFVGMHEVIDGKSSLLHCIGPSTQKKKK